MAAVDLGTVLSRHLHTEGINARELARRCDLSPSVLTRILSSETNPGADTLRRLHQGTGIPMTTLIVASGMFTATELGARVIPLVADQLTNDELLAVVRERMRPDTPPPADDVDSIESRPVERDPAAEAKSTRRGGRGRPAAPPLRAVEPNRSSAGI